MGKRIDHLKEHVGMWAIFLWCWYELLIETVHEKYPDLGNYFSFVLLVFDCFGAICAICLYGIAIAEMHHHEDCIDKVFNGTHLVCKAHGETERSVKKSWVILWILVGLFFLWISVSKGVLVFARSKLHKKQVEWLAFSRTIMTLVNLSWALTTQILYTGFGPLNTANKPHQKLKGFFDLGSVASVSLVFIMEVIEKVDLDAVTEKEES